MADVARSERGALREREPGDHAVAKFARLSGAMASCHQRGRLFPGDLVEAKHAVLEILLDQPRKRRLSLRSPAPDGHDCKTVMNLHYCDGSGPERCPSLTIEPRDDSRIRFGVHQLRHDIGVEDDHQSNLTGLTGYPRSSGIGFSSPMPRNSLTASEPNPPRRRPLSLTASRRMSRTSSSIDRPWRAARRCSLRLIASSWFG